MMFTRSPLTRVLALVAGLIAFGARPGTAQTYSILDLGTLGGNESQAFGINGAGSVVGKAKTADGFYRAFVWSAGQMRSLGTLRGGNSSAAFAVNDFDQVVGESNGLAGADVFHGFVFDPRTRALIDLGTLGGSQSSARGVNNAGLVVGLSELANGRRHAFAWKAGVRVDLGTLGGLNSGAFGANDAGLVVGQSDTTGRGAHGFVMRGAVMSDLMPLSGMPSIAMAINSAGQVTGSVGLVGGGTRAFAWQSGVLIELQPQAGFNSIGLGINSSGFVVGSFQTLEGARHAFLWQGGPFIDLNSLLPANSGWVLLEASGINANGQIVGTGRLNGALRGFLLQQTARNVTGLLEISLASPRINSRTGRATQQVTIVNKSNERLPGPISLVLDALIAAQLVNPAGRTQGSPPLGSPYVNLRIGPDGVLTPGEKVVVTLQFLKAAKTGFVFTPRVLGGPGIR